MATKSLNLKSTGVQFSCSGTIDDGWGDTYINGIEAKGRKNSGKANITVNIPTVMSGINYDKINSITLSFNCSGWWDRYEQGAMYLGWEEANGTLHLIENGKTIGFYSTPTYHTTGAISIDTCLLSDGRVVFGFYGYNNRLVASNWWYVTNLSIVIDYTEPTYYTISTGSSPSGTGTITGGGTYEHGSTVTLTATPATGYKFKQWNDGNTDNPRTITVTGTAKYTATFEVLHCKITTAVSPSGSGTVTGGATSAYGSTLTLTARPATGYKFVKWNDGNTDNPRTVTVTHNATYTATFEKLSYTISANVSPSGSGTVEGAGTYEYGSTVTLTAKPATGYKFKQWNDSTTAASRTITVTKAATYTATFEKLPPEIVSVAITRSSDLAQVTINTPVNAGEKYIISVEVT